jgi:hypothetical protein
MIAFNSARIAFQTAQDCVNGTISAFISIVQIFFLKRLATMMLFLVENASPHAFYL